MSEHPDDCAPPGGQAGAGLAELFGRHRLELARFLRARCGGGDAEDLLQDLWIRVATHHAGPIANGRAYLFRAANNLVLDRRRGALRGARRDAQWLGDGAMQADRPDPAEPADESIARDQEAQLLRAAIDDLPPGAATALRLYRFEELDQAAVARAMGISRSGVEKHLAAAMKHLRARLTDCGWYGAAASHQDKAGVQTPPKGQDRRSAHPRGAGT